MIRNDIILGKPFRKDKINIDGNYELRDVYKVDINEVYGNDENGRIASYLSDYDANHKEPISSLDFENYNEEIRKYIIKSGSPESFRRTKEDIRNNGQIKTGIILSDGRIIDGNRRYTCLYELYKETSLEKYRYFECFVIPKPVTPQEANIIKSLELKYQFGEDEKEDYNPIDYLVDIYKNLVGEKKYLTPEEYCKKVNNQKKLNEIKQDMEKSIIMVEYLKYIGKPNRFEIAREMKLDGSLQELAVFKKKIGNQKWYEVSPTFLRYIDICKGDKTRQMRGFIKTYFNKPSEYNEISNNIYEQEEINYHLNHNHYSEEVKEQKKEEFEELTKIISADVKNAETDINIQNARKKQITALKDVINKFDKLAFDEVEYMTPSEKNSFVSTLQILKRKVESKLEGLNKNVK